MKGILGGGGGCLAARVLLILLSPGVEHRDHTAGPGLAGLGWAGLVSLPDWDRTASVVLSCRVSASSTSCSTLPCKKSRRTYFKFANFF